MTEEECARWTQRIDALQARLQKHEPVRAEVKALTAEVFEAFRAEVATEWHLHQLQSAIRGLTWNVGAATPAVPIVGLSMTLSALELMLVPLEKVEPELRESAASSAVHEALQLLDSA